MDVKTLEPTVKINVGGLEYTAKINTKHLKRKIYKIIKGIKKLNKLLKKPLTIMTIEKEIENGV